MWVDIAGEARRDLHPDVVRARQALRVRATFVDGLGFTEQAASALTGVVTQPATVTHGPFIVQQQGLAGLPDTAARTGTAINIFLPVVSTFGDAQTAPAALTFTATLADGSPLSSVGLAFNVIGAPGAVTGATITNINPGGLVNTGAISVRVTATDTGPGAPLSVTDTFIINVQQGNRAPVATPVAPLDVDEGATVTGVVTGTDPDGTPVAFRLVAALRLAGLSRPSTRRRAPSRSRRLRMNLTVRRTRRAFSTPCSMVR